MIDLEASTGTNLELGAEESVQAEGLGSDEALVDQMGAVAVVQEALALGPAVTAWLCPGLAGGRANSWRR